MDKPNNVLIKKIKNILIIVLSFIIFTILNNGNLCYFKATIGFPCPGCGLTRSYLCLFKGDLKGAFYYHPLFLLPLIVFMVFFLYYQPFIEIKIVKKLYNSKVFWICILIPLAILYVIRLILFFPNVEPMNYNENNILLNTFKHIFNLIKRK